MSMPSSPPLALALYTSLIILLAVAAYIAHMHAMTKRLQTAASGNGKAPAPFDTWPAPPHAPFRPLPGLGVAGAAPVQAAGPGGGGAGALRGLVARIGEEGLSGLLSSRLDDMGEETEGVPQAVARLGLLDEIRILSRHAGGDDAETLQELAAALRSQLEEMGAEVIDDDAWAPSRQKAVEVLRDLPAGTAPVVAEKVASGLAYRGRVCRKQAVILRTDPHYSPIPTQPGDNVH